MKLFICSNRCHEKVVQYLIENNFYFVIFDTDNKPQKFLDLFCSTSYSVLNQVDNTCIESKEFLPGETYQVALYIKTNNLKIAIKMKEDVKVKRIYSDRFDFLPIKNNSNAFKTYLYAHIKQNKTQATTTLLIENDGYGDCILVMVLIRAGLDSKKLDKTSLTIYHMYPSSYHLSELFLSDCHNEMYPLTDELSFLKSTNQYEMLEKIKSSSIIRISNNLIRSAYTKVKELASVLGINYNNSLLDFQIPFLPLSNDIIEKIRDLHKTKDYLIGVQFYTSHDNIAYISRTYSHELAQIFIDICRQNNIGVINLSEYAGHTLHTDLDLNQLTINELFSAIHEMDMVVGIDSCCGHIAGALKKKNLILLGRIINNSSQRPYSMNYTIVSEKGDVNTIPPEEIYKMMMTILTDRISLDPHVKDVYDYSFDMTYL